MSKALTCLLLFFPSFSYAGELHVSGLGGINNYADSMFIADTDAVDARNVITYEGDLRPVPGSTLHTTVASSSVTMLGEYVNPTGQRVLFSKSGLSVYAPNPNTGVIAAIKTFDSEREVDIVSAFGAAYIVDGSESFWSDGVSTYTATNMSACRYVDFYANRLVCVSVSTETSRMNLSAYNSSTTWTVGSGDDDAAVKYFSKDDGYRINCVKATPYGIFVGKDRSSHILKGDSNPAFYQFPLSDTVGCSDDRSVQFVDGVIMWLGNEGNVYGWGGEGKIQNMSDEVRGFTKDIKKSQSLESTWSVATQTGWEAGTYAGWETAVSPGAMRTRTYDSGPINTGAVSHFMPGMFNNSGFEDGTSAGWTPTFSKVVFGRQPPNSYQDGRDYQAQQDCTGATANLKVHLDILNAADDAVIIAHDFPIYCDANESGTGLYGVAFSSPTIPGSGDIKLRVVDVFGTAHVSTAFNRAYGVWFTAGARSEYSTGCSGDSCLGAVFYDSIEGYAPAGTIMSAVYDTAITAPGENLTVDIYGSDGMTLNYYASADSATWVSTGIAVGGAIPATYQLRYFKFNASLPVSSASVSYSSFTSIAVSLLNVATYYSPVTFTSAYISAWRTFAAGYTSSGTTPIFSVRSGTYSFAADGATPGWTVQSSGGVLTISTGAYVQYKINPDIDVATKSMTMTSTNISYVVGAVAPRVASLTYDGHYLLSVSTYSETANHLTLFWQKNKKWTALEGQSYGAMTIYNNRPLAGDGSTGSKLWYLLDPAAKSYAGTAINSWWQTKDYTLGSVNNHKVFSRLWLNADGGGVDSLAIAWQPDRNGTWYSTSTVLSGSSFVIREVSGLFENYNISRQVRFRFSANEADRDFRIKLFSLYFEINPLIQ